MIIQRLSHIELSFKIGKQMETNIDLHGWFKVIIDNLNILFLPESVKCIRMRIHNNIKYRRFKCLEKKPGR